MPELADRFGLPQQEMHSHDNTLVDSNSGWKLEARVRIELEAHSGRDPERSEGESPLPKSRAQRGISRRKEVSVETGGAGENRT
jgi:hypothetical protein